MVLFFLLNYLVGLKLDCLDNVHIIHRKQFFDDMGGTGAVVRRKIIFARVQHLADIHK